jgi:vacuolar-type H+-ATPase subunit C/Vma6
MLRSLEIPLPENIQESEETVSDIVMVSRSVYTDVISCITDIKTVLSAKYLGHDQISVSDRPHPIFLDDAVHDLQTMRGQVKPVFRSRYKQNLLLRYSWHPIIHP